MVLWLSLIFANYYRTWLTISAGRSVTPVDAAREGGCSGNSTPLLLLLLKLSDASSQTSRVVLGILKGNVTKVRLPWYSSRDRRGTRQRIVREGREVDSYPTRRGICGISR